MSVKGTSGKKDKQGGNPSPGRDWIYSVLSDTKKINLAFVLAYPDMDLVNRCRNLRDIFSRYCVGMGNSDLYAYTSPFVTANTTRYTFGISTMWHNNISGDNTRPTVAELLAGLDVMGYAEIAIGSYGMFPGHVMCIVKSGGNYYILQSFYCSGVYINSVDRREIIGLLSGYIRYTYNPTKKLLVALTGGKCSYLNLFGLSKDMVNLTISYPKHPINLINAFNSRGLLLERADGMLTILEAMVPEADKAETLLEIVELCVSVDK